MKISCQRCGRCCTSFGVLVTPFDVQRIAEAIGKKPEEFVTILPEPPEREREEPAILIRKKSDQEIVTEGREILINGERVLLVLKWKKGKGEECFFYSENGCMIYQSRPMLCRTYPFKKNKRSLEDMKSRACICRWKPDKSGTKEYKEAIVDYEKELKAYRKIAKEWNDLGGGTLQGFLVFVLSRIKE